MKAKVAELLAIPWSIRWSPLNGSAITQHKNELRSAMGTSAVYRDLEWKVNPPAWQWRNMPPNLPKLIHPRTEVERKDGIEAESTVTRPGRQRRGLGGTSMYTIVLVILILLSFGALSTWPYNGPIDGDGDTIRADGWAW